MSYRPLILELPLLSAGLPAAREASLRRVGVPLTESVRHTANGEDGRRVVCRFALYDSRLPASRHAAAGLIDQGITTIDLASLKNATDTVSSAKERDPSPDSETIDDEWLAELKRELESAGGVWLRFADWPFPYQGVFCDGRRQDDEILQPVWQTTPEALNRWRQTRFELSVRLHRHKGGYRIELVGDPRGFQPAVELWRGDHVATLPLAEQALNVRDSGLVFLRARRIHPHQSWVDRVLDAVRADSAEHRRRKSA